MRAATDRAHAAWQHYVSEGQIVPQLLRPGVRRAWEIAHASKVNPALVAAPTRRPQETEQLLMANEGLIASARLYLEATSAAVANEEHAALLGAADGTLVASRAGDGPARCGPGPGALLGESNVGANGIGTALAQRDYVEVVGHEHFIRGFHQHHCQALPLWSPSGEMVGALCLSNSVDGRSSAEARRELVRIAALGIEAELRAMLLQRTLTWLRTDSTAELSLLARLHQDVVQSQTSARLQMELGARRMGQGGGGTLVENSSASLRAFMRTSAVWQLASCADGVSPPVVGIAELGAGIAELLQTEARMHGVKLEVSSGRSTTATAAEHADGTTARRLLLETHHLLRTAERFHGRVLLHWLPRAQAWDLVALSQRGVVLAERSVRARTIRHSSAHVSVTLR